MKKIIFFLAFTIVNFTLYAQFIDKGIRPDIAQKSKIDIHPVKSEIKSVSLSHAIKGLPPVKKSSFPINSFKPNPTFNNVPPGVLQKTKEKIDNLKEFYPDEQGNGNRTTVPVIGTNFEGNEYNGYRPPDNAMAISSSGYIVSLTNCEINYYNSEGALLYQNSFEGFFNQPDYPLYDPKILYDPGANRFIMVILEGYTPSHSIVKVCFSMSDNPLNGWWVYNIAGDLTGGGNWFDYPAIGISTHDLYITGNMFNGNNDFQQTEVLMFQKEDGYNGNPMSFVYWTNISFSPSSIVPASGGKGTYGPGIYMIASDYGNQRYLLYHVTNDINHNPVMEAHSISAIFEYAGNAPQYGTSVLLDNGWTRIKSAFYQGFTLHFVHSTSNAAGFNRINYNRLSTWLLSNNSYSFGLDGYDYSYPSVAYNGISGYDDDALIGFLRSGTNIYPEFRVVKYDDSGVPSNSSVLVKSGETYIDVNPILGVERWGDYTGISRKPGCSPEIWVAGCYGKNTAYDNHAYGTWIAQVTDGGDEITVTSPNGGENWKAGTTCHITWNSNLPAAGIYCGAVKIELYKGSELYQEITSYTSSSNGSYSWYIPSNIPLDDNYRIKITSLGNSFVNDFSDNDFSIYNSVPNSPYLIFLTSVSTSRIDVNWNNVSYETGYHIFRSEDGGVTFFQVGTTGADTTVFQDTGLDTYTRYCYKVNAYNAAGSSGDIGPACTYTRQEPIIVSSPNGGEDWQQATSQVITWFDTISEDVIIELYLNDSYYSTIAYSTPSDESYSWTIPFDQPVSDFYKIKISSTVDSSAIHNYSDNYFTISAPSPPLEPDFLSLTVISCNQINLSWGNVSNETGYKILRSSGGSYSQIGLTEVDITTFQDTGLLPSTFYSYKIAPYNTAGSPQIINSLSVLTPAAPFVTVITPNGSDSLRQGVADTITWTGNIEGKVKIELYRNGNYSSTIDDSTSYNNVLWIVPSDQIPDSSYQIKITSVADTSLHDFSDTCFTIEENISPNILVQNTSIYSGENQCFDATNIITVAGDGNPVEVKSGGEANFIAGGKILLQPGFHAYSGSYCKAYITLTGDYCSTLQPVTLAASQEDDMNTIDEILEESVHEISLYPNPSTGNLTIDFHGKETTAEIRLLNLQGSEMYRASCHQQLAKKINISKLPRGMYLVLIKTPEKMYTQKVIKN